MFSRVGRNIAKPRIERRREVAAKSSPIQDSFIQSLLTPRTIHRLRAGTQRRFRRLITGSGDWVATP